ncbi:hypothetical protein [Streptomyces sp. NPDC006691]|uniref:hypothetical protein n=1 Tax=Streptomyces sp. NPDC006691 TaxID=3364757 RepID=UPI003689A3D2
MITSRRWLYAATAFIGLSAVLLPAAPAWPVPRLRTPRLCCAGLCRRLPPMSPAASSAS